MMKEVSSSGQAKMRFWIIGIVGLAMGLFLMVIGFRYYQSWKIAGEVPNLYVVGAYSAKNKATVPVEIETNTPIILALSANDSIDWNIRTSLRSQLRKVIVSGNETQSVNVLPSSCAGQTHSFGEKIACSSHKLIQWIFTPKTSVENYSLSSSPDEKFYAYDTGEELPEHRGFPLRGTASGLVIIDDPLELAELDVVRNETAKREQENHKQQYARLVQTLKGKTGLDISHFAGTEIIISAAIDNDGITITKEPPATRESTLAYLEEYNKKFMQRQIDLRTPIQEEDIPSKFVFEPFKTPGYGGENHDHAFSFGKYGNVYDIDAFLKIGGMDLNGDTRGTNAQISADPLPSWLSLSLSPSLSDDEATITLDYIITNTSSGALQDVAFYFFLDPETIYGGREAREIAENRTDEYGEMSGTIGDGNMDAFPDSWEIDEPEFVFGNIITNLLLGMLDNSNNVLKEFHDDPSYGLGFEIGSLPPSQAKTVSIVLSTKDKSIGSLKLMHKDKRLSDVLTISGEMK